MSEKPQPSQEDLRFYVKVGDGVTTSTKAEDVFEDHWDKTDEIQGEENLSEIQEIKEIKSDLSRSPEEDKAVQETIRNKLIQEIDKQLSEQSINKATIAVAKRVYIEEMEDVLERIPSGLALEDIEKFVANKYDEVRKGKSYKDNHRLKVLRHSMLAMEEALSASGLERTKLEDPVFRQKVGEFFQIATEPDSEADKHADKREHQAAGGMEYAALLILNNVEGLKVGKGNQSQDYRRGIDGIVELTVPPSKGHPQEQIIFTYDLTTADPNDVKGKSIVEEKQSASRRRLGNRHFQREVSRLINGTFQRFSRKEFKHDLPIVLNIPLNDNFSQQILESGYDAFMQTLILDTPESLRTSKQKMFLEEMEHGRRGKKFRSSAAYVLELLSENLESEYHDVQPALDSVHQRKINRTLTGLEMLTAQISY